MSSSSASSAPSQEELFRFLEDRFVCAQACTECARTSALRASFVDPDGSTDDALVRRKGILCAEVCDATCRLLSEQAPQDEAALRVQLEWCRTVCLETAQLLDDHLGAGDAAKACRECAQACADFVRTLAAPAPGQERDAA
ncbi:ferredoxin [Streptomyces geranii]|uniref:ferredoxin n=1 Tax=Streptomyces geranii TaxID=2058923 RepID=UPI000D03F700|nr:ferredoxin [Streptomyces geranii]